MYYDYRKLLTDYSVPFNDEIAIHRGYITVPCPFCSSTKGKYHGAIHIHNNVYKCWKCSGRSLYDFVRTVTGQNWYVLQKKYITTLTPYRTIPEEKERPSQIVLPPATGELNERAIKYLEKRGFDPYKIGSDYDLKSTNHLGPYNFRIIIPIYFQGEMVSYTSRDYTNRSDIRYLSCKTGHELIDHKTIVYGYDSVPDGHVIVVEGPIDKWKMGINSVSTFGISFKNEQVNILNSFKNVSILYDNEYAAQKQAEKLGNLLSGLGTSVDIITISDAKDPGALPLDEAESLAKEILKKK